MFSKKDYCAIGCSNNASGLRFSILGVPGSNLCRHTILKFYILLKTLYANAGIYICIYVYIYIYITGESVRWSGSRDKKKTYRNQK